MAKFKVAVGHEMTRQDAIVKLQVFSQSLKDQVRNEVSEVREQWDDQGNLIFSFRALGFQVSGQVVTCESEVTVFGILPFAALPFRGAIESQVAEKIKQAISSPDGHIL